ncbi:AAA family ATPase [Pseudomonas stutzeri]|uniref:AAA family ATPase n=1 Tax=Stutzerimonas stutzeri TaxID=316 RepID=UPI00210C0BBB|nr:AAA family ATPase [Stutzerimonas stutzeri]MCQ4298084.1 AAA family ATPase [Stutzerimonas stutzeri]
MDTEHIFYLPIARTTLHQLQDAQHLESFLASSSTAEQIALIFLLHLPRIAAANPSSTALERAFARALEKASTRKSGEPNYDPASDIRGCFLPGTVTDRLKSLPQYRIKLLTAGEVRQADYLSRLDRLWDFSFWVRQREREKVLQHPVSRPDGSISLLSRSQSVLYNEMRNNMEESLHVQAYAGAGKTFLISYLFELLDPDRTLLLSNTPGQVKALTERITRLCGIEPDKLHAMTIGVLASRIINGNRTRDSWIITDHQRTYQQYAVSSNQIAQWLQLPRVGGLSPATVATICQRTVKSYCESSARSFNASHLPAIAVPLTQADVCILLELSETLWREIVSPSEPWIRLPIRHVHRIKFLSLRRDVIPERFTHVVVDECHELTPAMLTILDRSPQAVITLGDEFQSLSRLAARRGNFIRPRIITESVRAGAQMGQVLNPLIIAHPSTFKDPFVGRAEHRTDVVQYDELEIPNDPTTVLCANEWGVLDWVLRLIDAGARFRVPEKLALGIHLLVSDLFELYSHGTPARHRNLLSFHSWDHLQDSIGAVPGLARFTRRVERGGSLTDFLNDLSQHQQENAPITLMRAEDAKNQEFDRVVVSPDFLRMPKLNDVSGLGTLCASLYTAASRAKHKLIVPGQIDGWTMDAHRKAYSTPNRS